MALNDRKLSNGKNEHACYLEFLQASGSDYSPTSPKMTGVDMPRPEPYFAALKQFERQIGEMEKIVAILIKIKKP